MCGAWWGGEWLPPCLQATCVCINPEFNLNFVFMHVLHPRWSGWHLQGGSTLHLAEVLKGQLGYEHDGRFPRKMYHVLLEVAVLEGTPQCPESACLIPISRGIPNMLLTDEESET